MFCSLTLTRRGEELGALGNVSDSTPTLFYCSLRSQETLLATLTRDSCLRSAREASACSLRSRMPLIPPPTPPTHPVLLLAALAGSHCSLRSLQAIARCARSHSLCGIQSIVDDWDCCHPGNDLELWDCRAISRSIRGSIGDWCFCDGSHWGWKERKTRVFVV